MALVEGSVRVSNSAKDSSGQTGELLLQPGQSYTWNRKSGEAHVAGFDEKSLLAWLDGRMVFKSTPLSTVARSIERRFGIEVYMENADIGNAMLTANFEKESLEDILQLISIATGLHYAYIREPGHPERVVISRE